MHSKYGFMKENLTILEIGSSPETFIMQWKNLMEDNPSIRKMEEVRQNAIKENLSTFLKENQEERILSVIEYEMKNHLENILNSEVES